jgi:hypothetical protein
MLVKLIKGAIVSALTSTFYPGVTHRELFSKIRTLAKSGRALFLHGAPGIGKSEGLIAAGADPGIKQIAWSKWGAGKGIFVSEDLVKAAWEAMGLPFEPELPNLEVIQLTIPQMESEDFTGAPFHKWLDKDGNERATVWAPSEFLRHPYPVIMFLDEVSSADVRVQKVLLQIVQERKVFNVSLADGTIVVMAGNRAEDRAAVKTVPFPLGNRASHWTMQVDHESWEDWAKTRKDIPACFMGWVHNKKEEALLNFDPENESLAQLTPRSFYAAANDYFYGMEDGLEWDEIRDLIHSEIGTVDGLALCAYLQLRNELPSWDEIVRQGAKAKLPGRGHVDRVYYVVSIMLDHFRRMKEYSKDVDPVLAYVGALAKDAPDAVDALAWMFNELLAVHPADTNLGKTLLNKACEIDGLAEKVGGFFEKVRT